MGVKHADDMEKVKIDDKIYGLKDKCWSLLNIVRGDISANEYYVILYLITLFKERIDLRVVKSNQSRIDVELPSIIRGNKESDEFNFVSLHAVFKPTLDKLHEHTYQEIRSVLVSIDFQVLEIHFAEIFDDLLYKINGYQGKLGGEVIQARELTRFISGLVDQSSKTVYNPFAGFASFGVFLNGVENYLGQELNQMTWAIGSLRIIAHNKVSVSRFIQGDSILNWNPTRKYKSSRPEDIFAYPSETETFDLIIANPPFGLRLQNQDMGQFGTIRTCEHFMIEKGIEALSPSGRLIAIIPSGFLFRSGSEYNLRQFLIEKDLLEAVISFPGGLLMNTNIPFVVLVINKNKEKRGYTRFADARTFVETLSRREKRLNDIALNAIIRGTDESEALRIVSNTVIQDFDFNLNVASYFQKKIEGVQLSELVSLVRGQQPTENQDGVNIRIRDLKDDRLDFHLNLDSIEETENNNSKQFSKVVSESCLLLATRWRTFKPTYFTFINKPILISNDILALKVDETKVNIGYLVNELSSEYVLEQAESFRTGTVVPSLRKDDLLSIKIKLPEYHHQQQYHKSLEEQQAKFQGALETLLSEKKKELILFKKIHGLETEIVEQNTYLRHTLAGPTSNLIGSIENIRKIIDSKVLFKVPELMTLKLSDKHELTFGKYFEIIERDIQKISQAVRRQLKVDTEIDSRVLKPIDIISFLMDYVKEFEARAHITYSVEFSFDKEVFLDSEGKITRTFINADQELLIALLDNLVSNAVKHAFSNTAKDRIEIFLMKYLDDGGNDIQILFSNTGRPFPENLTKEGFVRKGITAGPNAGEGFGGWYINEVIKRLHGSFEIIDETSGEGLPDSDLATSFEINFPIIESEENEAV